MPGLRELTIANSIPSIIQGCGQSADAQRSRVYTFLCPLKPRGGDCRDELKRVEPRVEIGGFEEVQEDCYVILPLP